MGAVHAKDGGRGVGEREADGAHEERFATLTSKDRGRALGAAEALLCHTDHGRRSASRGVEVRAETGTIAVEPHVAIHHNELHRLRDLGKKRQKVWQLASVKFARLIRGRLLHNDTRPFERGRLGVPLLESDAGRNDTVAAVVDIHRHFHVRTGRLPMTKPAPTSLTIIGSPASNASANDVGRCSPATASQAASIGDIMRRRCEEIRAKLDHLRDADREFLVFGARGKDGHNYRETPPLSDEGIARLERDCGVTLPEELAAFVRYVHSGGAGPGYGFDLWGEPRCARPFPYSMANFTELVERRKSQRGASLPLGDDDDPDACWPPGPGFLAVAHLGCGVYDAIVSTGELRGTMWCCDMAWRPYTSSDRPMGFLDWYESWLDRNLSRER